MVRSDQAVFRQGSDWKVQFDFEDAKGVCAPFPPEIAAISDKGSRPDGVLWSETQTVVWIELTWEENLRKNHDLKKGRYNQLAIDLREGKHVGGIRWKVVPLCVDVGCRGAINEGPWYGMKGHGMDCVAGWAPLRPSLAESPRHPRRQL